MNQPASLNRAYALDALRGLAILAMLLSGQLPFDGNALPSWMYHAQEPPPSFEWNGALPGISWVDLVFPFFLFSMGAAFPLALAKRMEKKPSVGHICLYILERGFLLGFFALFVQAIRPYTLNNHPTTATFLLALLGFFILFPILTPLPQYLPKSLKISIRVSGWIGAILFFVFTTYPNGSGFSLQRSDIIIIVLTNMAVFGSAVWILTRENLILRLGVIGLMFAIRMSNMPHPIEGWVHGLWLFPNGDNFISRGVHAFYQLYYLQYLCIVIPGTIAGDLILKWTRVSSEAEVVKSSTVKLIVSCVLMVALVLVLLIGLKGRWISQTVIATFALLAIGWRLFASPLNETEQLYKKLFCWAAYWLVLGLIFEPYEGGIRKDHPTLSYYFITAGLAHCVFIGFSILIDVLRQKRWVQLLIDTGQNPMVAYAGINNFITPILALIGAETLLNHFATTPWRGFWRGVIITLLMALSTSFLTRRKIFWRT